MKNENLKNVDSQTQSEEASEFERFETLAKQLLGFRKPVPDAPPEPKKGPRSKDR